MSVFNHKVLYSTAVIMQARTIYMYRSVQTDYIYAAASIENNGMHAPIMVCYVHKSDPLYAPLGGNTISLQDRYLTPAALVLFLRDKKLHKSKTIRQLCQIKTFAFLD